MRVEPAAAGLRDQRGRPQRWRRAEPIRRRDLKQGRTLLIHPPTGSWVIVATGRLRTVRGLLQAAQSGLLDQCEGAETSPLVQRLSASGLLIRAGPDDQAAPPVEEAVRSLSMLILKLVGYCNLACAYCYDYNQRTARSRMPLSTAQNAITQAFEQSRDGLNILFHGGEPLLAFDAIRRLVPFARAAAATLGRRVEFSIQTNGTLFTPENVEFLLGERFSIGISLDGRCPINDRLRVDYAGKGCHTAIERDLRAYPALTDQIGVLTTVTRFNVAHLLDTALYVQDLGVRRWAATLFQAAGRAAGDAPRFAPATADLAAAYRSLLDAIEQGRFTRLEVRPVLDYIRNVTSRQRRSMCLRDRCGAARELASVSVTGDVEACDCIKDMRLRIGSMENGGIPEALASPVAQSIRDRSTGGLRRCRTCEWRAFCGGTCLAKAGALDGIDRQECALARVLLPEIFRRLAASDKLERYAQLFA